LHLRKQVLAFVVVEQNPELRPAALHAAIGPGVLERPAELAFGRLRVDLHQPCGQGADEEVEVVPQRGARQLPRNRRCTPAPAGQAQPLRERGLQGLHRIADLHVRRRQHPQRNAGGLCARKLGRQTREACQPRPGGGVQAGLRRCVFALHAFGALQDLRRGQSGARLCDRAAYDDEVFGGERALFAQAHRHRCQRLAATERLARHRAIRRVQAGKGSWRQACRIQGRAEPPGLQAQREPLAQRTRRSRHAGTEDRAACAPALADGAAVQQCRRRHEAMLRVIPADLEGHRVGRSGVAGADRSNDGRPCAAKRALESKVSRRVASTDQGVTGPCERFERERGLVHRILQSLPLQADACIVSAGWLKA